MALTPQEAQEELGQLNAPIVSTVDAPGGGTWALGADGGVFSLGGAPFFGSYTGLPPEGRQGERSFVSIRRWGSGYELISNLPGQTYHFGSSESPVDPPLPPPPPAEPPPADTEGETSEAIIRKILAPWGLSELTPKLLERAVVIGPELAIEEIKDSPQYKARFPGLEALRTKGRAISEAEYISYEKTAAGMFRQFGLPAGFYDQPADFAEFISGEVSVKELGDRIQQASIASFSAPVEVRQELERLYGVTPGNLTAYFLDPDRALPELEKQALAAQTGAAARRTGFGLLTAQEAERLGGLGVSPEQAQAGFGELAGAADLFGTLPGEAGVDITREEQLAATFEGSAAAQEKIRRRQGRRTAEFGGGGGFAAGQGGVSGLGGG